MWRSLRHRAGQAWRQRAAQEQSGPTQPRKTRTHRGISWVSWKEIAVFPVYHGDLAGRACEKRVSGLAEDPPYFRSSRASPRFTWALRRPSSRLAEAFFLPASITGTLLLTATA